MAATFGFYDLSTAEDADLRAGLAPALSASADASDKVAVPGERVHLSKTSAYRLRASTIDACEYVVRRAHELAKEDTSGERAWLGQMTAVALDGYLWSVAKDDSALRRVPRIVEKTIFY
jgi:hypothetical protein